jgi:hypothetical protein
MASGPWRCDVPIEAKWVERTVAGVKMIEERTNLRGKAAAQLFTDLINLLEVIETAAPEKTEKPH